MQFSIFYFIFYFQRSAVKKLNGFVHHSNSQSTLQHCHYWSVDFILYHTAWRINIARVSRNCSPGKYHVADQLSNLFLIITFDLNDGFVILATPFSLHRPALPHDTLIPSLWLFTCWNSMSIYLLYLACLWYLFPHTVCHSLCVSAWKWEHCLFLLPHFSPLEWM